MSWIGQSASSSRDASGTTTYGAFESIDSAMILVGLNIGILPLDRAAGQCRRRDRRARARLPQRGARRVVAILPGLTSVAFITQFTTFFWFVVGLAVAQTVRVVGPDPDSLTKNHPLIRSLVGGSRGAPG